MNGREYLKEHNIGPSKLIRMMIDGLRATEDRDDCEVNMSTYGSFTGDVCYGCAATYTLMNLTKSLPNRTGEHSPQARSLSYGLPGQVVDDIETYIDLFRLGAHKCLSPLFGVELPAPKHTLFTLRSQDWKFYLPSYESYAEQLEEVGL